MHDHLDRNLIGYGPNPPDPQWPGDARIAVSFVLNYEEGGENTILNGDAASEVFLTETPGGGLTAILEFPGVPAPNNTGPNNTGAEYPSSAQDLASL